MWQHPNHPNLGVSSKLSFLLFLEYTDLGQAQSLIEFYRAQYAKVLIHD